MQKTERPGFEPGVPFPAQLLSRQLPSANSATSPEDSWEFEDSSSLRSYKILFILKRAILNEV
jgi:hypothetical protein